MDRSVNPSRKLPRFESWICHQQGNGLLPAGTQWEASYLPMPSYGGCALRRHLLLNPSRILMPFGEVCFCLRKCRVVRSASHTLGAVGGRWVPAGRGRLCQMLVQVYGLAESLVSSQSSSWWSCRRACAAAKCQYIAGVWLSVGRPLWGDRRASRALWFL
jgi:hypothetical protein